MQTISLRRDGKIYMGLTGRVRPPLKLTSLQFFLHKLFIDRDRGLRAFGSRDDHELDQARSVTCNVHSLDISCFVFACRHAALFGKLAAELLWQF